MLSQSFSPKARKRATALQAAVAAGQEADLCFFETHQNREFSLRPIGKVELDAYRTLAGIQSLPGIRRPALYGVVAGRRDDDRVLRAVHLTTRALWLSCVKRHAGGDTGDDFFLKSWWHDGSRALLFLPQIEIGEAGQ